MNNVKIAKKGIKMWEILNKLSFVEKELLRDWYGDSAVYDYKQSLAKRMKELISDDTYILHNEEERELMNCIRNDVLRELALSEDLKE